MRSHGFNVIPELSGHGVGRKIHEEPPIPNCPHLNNHDMLTEGMVIAVEPIIAAGAGEVHEERDGWTIVTADSSCSKRITSTR